MIFKLSKKANTPTPPKKNDFIFLGYGHTYANAGKWQLLVTVLSLGAVKAETEVCFVSEGKGVFHPFIHS